MPPACFIRQGQYVGLAGKLSNANTNLHRNVEGFLILLAILLFCGKMLTYTGINADFVIGGHTMVIGIFGESCTGKTTLAEKIAAVIPCSVFAGKDYLRLAKNESIAKVLFQKKLDAAMCGEHIIYVISEDEHLSFLPDGALRILVTAELEMIKARFTQRMHGHLPAPVATMLEKKHGCFDSERHDIHVVSGETDLDAVVAQIEVKL